MKYVKHTFVDFGNHILPSQSQYIETDWCIICNKTISGLCDEYNISFEPNPYSEFEFSKDTIGWLTENTNCLTEDEFTIKSIIE